MATGTILVAPSEPPRANRVAAGTGAKSLARRLRKQAAQELGPGTTYVNVATAARLLGISRRTVLYLLEEGKLEGRRIPPRGWWKIRRASLGRLVTQSEAAR